MTSKCILKNFLVSNVIEKLEIADPKRQLPER